MAQGRYGNFAAGGGLPPEKIIERTERAAIVELTVPEACEYFDGHFPEYKVLPGVAQFGIALAIAARCFGTGLLVSRIKRVKYVNMIRPGAVIRVEISREPERRFLAFRITDAGDGRVYSSGTLTLAEDA